MRNSKEDKGMSTNGRKTRKEDGIRRKRQNEEQLETERNGAQSLCSTLALTLYTFDHPFQLLSTLEQPKENLKRGMFACSHAHLGKETVT